MIPLTPKQRQVYNIIRMNPNITSRELCYILSCQRQTLFDKLTILEDNGLIIAKLLDNHHTKSYRVDKRRKQYAV